MLPCHCLMDTHHHVHVFLGWGMQWRDKGALVVYTRQIIVGPLDSFLWSTESRSHFSITYPIVNGEVELVIRGNCISVLTTIELGDRIVDRVVLILIELLQLLLLGDLVEGESESS